MMIVFFLEDNVSEAQRALIEKRLKESALINNIRFIPSEQALIRFRQNFPELQGIVENIKVNPFPSSYETNISDERIAPDTVLKFIQEIKEMRGVEDVQFNKDWVEKMQSLSRLARAIGFFLGGILALASFFIISNVIKLNVLARQSEIVILRMVGATNIFIRIPFLLEGMILGILGGLVSNFRYLTLSQMGLLVAAGAVIGFMGSLSSLARFLKV